MQYYCIRLYTRIQNILTVIDKKYKGLSFPVLFIYIIYCSQPRVVQFYLSFLNSIIIISSGLFLYIAPMIFFFFQYLIQTQYGQVTFSNDWTLWRCISQAIKNIKAIFSIEIWMLLLFVYNYVFVFERLSGGSSKMCLKRKTAHFVGSFFKKKA